MVPFDQGHLGVHSESRRLGRRCPRVVLPLLLLLRLAVMTSRFRTNSRGGEDDKRNGWNDKLWMHLGIIGCIPGNIIVRAITWQSMYWGLGGTCSTSNSTWYAHESHLAEKALSYYMDHRQHQIHCHW
jgi:hypothetical protein